MRRASSPLPDARDPDVFSHARNLRSYGSISPASSSAHPGLAIAARRSSNIQLKLWGTFTYLMLNVVAAREVWPLTISVTSIFSNCAPGSDAVISSSR